MKIVKSCSVRILCFATVAALCSLSCQKELHRENGLLDESSGILNGNGSNCLGVNINGIYVKDSQTNGSNSVEVILTVSSPGHYYIHTDTVNGLFFGASDTFSVARVDTVTLAAHGKPIAAGSYVYHVRYNNSSCSFIINVSEVSVPEDTATVFFGSFDGYFYAVGAISGTLKWKYQTGAILSSASLLDSFVYIGSRDHNLYAIHARTGVFKWNYYTGGWPSGGEISEGTMSTNGYVYFSCANGKTYSIDTTLTIVNGIGYPKLKWIYSSGNGGSGTPTAPTIKGGVAFFGADTTFYAISAQTGVLKWKYSPGEDCDRSNPAVVNDIVYMATQSNVIHALNAQTGSLIWKRNLEPGVVTGAHSSSPVIANNIVYVPTDDNNVKAIDALTGNILWSTQAVVGSGGTTNATVAVANDMIYCPNDNGYLFAWSATNGVFKWKFATGETIYGAPTVVNNIVYIGSLDRHMYAIDAISGTLKWKFLTGGQIFSSPFVSSSSGHQYYPGDSGGQN